MNAMKTVFHAVTVNSFSPPQYCMYFSYCGHSCIVSRGDWLGNPPNIKVENNGAVGYVGSSLTVHNPLFSLYYKL